MSAKGIVLGNPSSSVAVCTLWTQTDLFEAALDKTKYRLIGNLYSFNGLSKLIRTIYEYPEIRTIILCGLDLGKAGEALVLLFENGVDENNKINGSTVIIEQEIPRENIELMRKSISLVDMRGTTKPEPVIPLLSAAKHLPAFSNPQTFPDPKPVNPSQFPTADSGFMISEESVALAFPKILGTIMRFGSHKKSHYNDVKEVLNLMVVLEPEDPDNPALPDYLGITKQDLEAYYPQLISNIEFEGTSYTYGNRLRHVPRKMQEEMSGIIDQIETIVEELKRAPYSRRAIALTWRVEEDITNKSPPCLILIQCMISDHKLHLTAFIRSNDMFAAWPKNAFGLRKLQQLIAAPLEVPIGTLTTISSSAHIYEQNWKDALQIAEKHSFLRWKQDSRGYFVIKIENNLIKLHHYNNNGPLLQTFEGTKAEELYKQLVLKETMSSPEHLAYIGMELAKAEIALKLKIPYIQEDDLKFPW